MADRPAALSTPETPLRSGAESPAAWETRKQIIETAERLYRQYGYRKTTVADIAAELGMSPANVYRFFASKDAISAEVATMVADAIRETVDLKVPEQTADTIRAAILHVDPTALVTVGFFPPDRPNVWNSAPRRIRTYPAIWNSSADFIDLHPYPGGYNLGRLVENFEMQGFAAKPVLMGELGAARSSFFSAAGASLTGFTVMLTVAVSVRPPSSVIV